MNELIRPTKRLATQAAEGVPRWRWTTAELLRLTELGAFTEDDHFELIGGEMVPMSPSGRRHEVVADELAQVWGLRVSPDFRVSTERQFNLDDSTYTEPDLIVQPVSIKIPDVRGDTALLVVGVSDSSLDYDRTTKAALYASFGVREYWSIDARGLDTCIHRTPGPAGYADVRDVADRELITPLLAPALAVRLAELDLA